MVHRQSIDFDLFPACSVETVRKWLVHHSGAGIISWDRIRIPRSNQISCHLLHNLMEARDDGTQSTLYPCSRELSQELCGRRKTSTCADAARAA
jgi:hypothetical protein